LPQSKDELWSTFDLVEAFHLSQATSTLHSLGVLETLRRPLTPEAAAKIHGLDPSFISGLLEYVAARTDLLRKTGKRFRSTESYSPHSRFLLELYTGAYRRNAVDLEKMLRHPGLAPAAVDRQRHARAFKMARNVGSGALPALIRKLQFNHVLDIGCGSGTLLIELAKQNPDFAGWGLELNPAMCKVARTEIRSAGIKKVQIVEGDSRNLQRALPADVRASVEAVTACQVANEMFGVGSSGFVEWLRGLSSVFPGRPLLIADYYGQLGSKDSANQREALLQDYVQLISGQGLPPSNLKKWKALYTEAGCRLLHAIEDPHTTRFIHVLVLAGWS
jgi:SAM-dependent methyltransferase